MEGPKRGGTRKVVGVLSEKDRKQDGFLLFADGDPRRRMVLGFPRPAESDDPRWRSLPQLSPLDLRPGSVALWGYPSGLAVQASDGETEIYEDFKVLYVEWLTTATTIAVPTTTTTHAPGDWIKVVSLSGKGDKRSESFTLTGAPALFTSERAGEHGEVGVNLVPDGSEPIKEGFNVSLSSGPGTGTFPVPREPGRYYLDVRSTGSEWTVTIEEKR